jgi:hypothetical protein
MDDDEHGGEPGPAGHVARQEVKLGDRGIQIGDRAAVVLDLGGEHPAPGEPPRPSLPRRRGDDRLLGPRGGSGQRIRKRLVHVQS